MTEVFEHPEHAGTWDAAVRGEKMDWESLLGAYQATVDWPACSFYKELMEEYPDARVLLSVRDPEKWYESVFNTIYGMRRTVSNPLFRTAIGALMPNMKRAGGMVNRLIWEGTFAGNFEDREYAISVFDRHNAEVVQSVPADRLLVYEVKEGWAPLCEFLGVEVPDKPFPHLNDTGDFRKMVRRRLVGATFVLFAGMLAVLALIRILRKSRS